MVYCGLKKPTEIRLSPGFCKNALSTEYKNVRELLVVRERSNARKPFRKTPDTLKSEAANPPSPEAHSGVCLRSPVDRVICAEPER